MVLLSQVPYIAKVKVLHIASVSVDFLKDVQLLYMLLPFPAGRGSPCICTVTSIQDPDPEVFGLQGSGSVIICADLDPDPDTSINMQKNVENLDFNSFVTCCL